MGSSFVKCRLTPIYAAFHFVEKLLNRKITWIEDFFVDWLSEMEVCFISEVLFNSEIWHHHVHEGLGVFPVPWSSKWNWSLHLFLGRPMCLRPFGLYCNACLGIFFVSIRCMYCSHFSWYCFISFTIFCAPVFPLIHWFFSLSSFVIPSNL